MNDYYYIEVWSKNENNWGPLKNGMVISPERIGSLVRDSAIYLSKGFDSIYHKEEIVTPYLKRKKIIDSIHSQTYPKTFNQFIQTLQENLV